MDIKILYEDEELLVLDKPSGITVNKSETTVGEETVQDWVAEYLNVSKGTKVPKVSNGELRAPFDTSDTFLAFNTFSQRAGIVHRLDKETSGIILVAKTLEVFINLQSHTIYCNGCWRLAR